MTELSTRPSNPLHAGGNMRSRTIWTTKKQKGEQMKSEFSEWRKVSDGVYRSRLECGSVGFRVEAYLNRDGWRWRIFLNHSTVPQATDLEEFSTPYAAARAAIEHLRQWAELVQKQCEPWADTAERVTAIQHGRA